MRLRHINRPYRAFPCAKAASDACLLIRHIGAPVGLIATCRFRQIKTVNGTGICADPAGHAGHFIRMSAFRERSLHHLTGNPKEVLHCLLRTDSSTGAALNAAISDNVMKRIFIPLYRISRAYPAACTTSIALVCDSVRHVPTSESQTINDPFRRPTRLRIPSELLIVISYQFCHIHRSAPVRSFGLRRFTDNPIIRP